MDRPKLVRVTLEFEDRVEVLDDPTDCAKWTSWNNSNASLAYAHGMRYTGVPLKWRVYKENKDEAAV